jgi:hypothetical protein
MVAVSGKCFEQPGPAFDVVADPLLEQDRSGVVDQRDVVVVVRPINPAEHCHSLLAFALGLGIELWQGTLAL